MIDTLTARGLDTVMFVNNFSERDAPLLDIADQRGFNVLMMSGGDWNRAWWPDDITPTLALARAAAQPVVDRLRAHSSFRGYIVRDEPALRDREKLTLLTQTLHELDPAHLAMPALIGTDRVGPLFRASAPDMMVLDVYPFGYHNPPCDTTMTGFGYPNLDFVDYIRFVAERKPPEMPLWFILQTHTFGNGGRFSLREPSPAEMRLEQWLAIGEGATSIFWFIYSTQQDWTRLADNSALLHEASDLAQRVRILQPVLLGLHKAADAFSVSGTGNPYVSTLSSSDGQHQFALVVDRDCQHVQAVSITFRNAPVGVRDVETGRMYRLYEPIQLLPGDGKLFEQIHE